MATTYRICPRSGLQFDTAAEKLMRFHAVAGVLALLVGGQVELQPGARTGTVSRCHIWFPLFHVNTAEHRVVPDAAVFIADNGVSAGLGRRHLHHVFISGDDLDIDVGRLQREAVVVVD